MTEIEVLVIAAQRWDFDDSDGQNHRGTTVYVSHVGEPQSQLYAGHKPVKYVLEHNAYKQFEDVNLPALAKMAVDYDFDRQKMVPKSFADFEPLQVNE